MSEIADALSRVGAGRIAVALSGGVDSAVLLDGLWSAGANVCAVHVDHRLRESSSGDASFCRRLCADRGIAFRCIVLDVEAGNSTQRRARIQRYAALVRGAAELGADVIATAHHADDAVETSFLQAWRGAGVVGRAGPRARSHWRGFPVIRPLLGVSRDQIEQHARSRRLRWREDPTNAATHYLRNYVRHEVLPHVDRDAARALMPRLRREADAFEQRLGELLDEVLRGAGPTWRELGRTDQTGESRELVGALALTVAEDLGGKLSGRLVAEIVDATFDDETESRRFCGRRVVVEVSGNSVVFEATRGQGTKLLDARSTPVVALEGSMTVPWFRHLVSWWMEPPSRLRRTPPAAEPPSRLRRTPPAAEPPSRLRRTPPAGGGRDLLGIEITLRGPRDGDRLGSELVHDLLAEEGVPPAQRWCWPCIFAGDECVRVCGVDRDDGAAEILLPDGRFSGIFVESHALNDTDAERKERSNFGW